MSVCKGRHTKINILRAQDNIQLTRSLTTTKVTQHVQRKSGHNVPELEVTIIWGNLAWVSSQIHILCKRSSMQSV